MTVLRAVLKTIKTEIWWMVTVLVMVTMVANVTSLSGPNVCMVKQIYNITKRVKYRAPMSIRTYEWCFAMPPRCSKWNTEMRDVTRLETEERTAEMAVCCPGYKLRDVSCVPHCPSGKTGQACSEDCPPNKWGPSCVYDCKTCDHGSCDATTGVCRCQDGWQGESCETSMTTTAAAVMMEQLLTTESTSTKTTSQNISTISSNTITSTAPTTTATSNDTASVSNFTPMSTKLLSPKEITSTTIATIPNTGFTTNSTRNSEESTTILLTTKSSIILSNTSIPTLPTLNTHNIVATEKITKETKKATVNYSNYNRTEEPSETNKKIPYIKTAAITEPIFKNDVEWTTLTPARVPTTTTKAVSIHQVNTKMSTSLTTTTTVKSSTRKIPTTVRQTVTTKPKAKEIWIKPAQKGEFPISEAKLKLNPELPHSKIKYKEIIEITTPKTIIVSIIPTSVTYVTFKKIVLTTSSLMAQKNNTLTTNNNRSTEKGSTKPMIVLTTSLPTTAKVLTAKINMSPTTNNSVLYKNVTKTNPFVPTTRRSFNTTMPTTPTTNSMMSTLNVSNKRLNTSFLTSISSFSTNVTKSRRKQHSLSDSTTSATMTIAHFNHKKSRVTETMTEQLTVPEQSVTIVQKNNTNRITELPNVTQTFIQKQANMSILRNVTNFKTTVIANSVTDDPTKDEETFHILTEPEHITAVMGDKRNEKSTINLISVISIAGGVMMAVITVAIIIVMLERCKKPRYEDVRKYNDIRMQVMIDKNDVPPPYVRSIFHTPLPDPPTSEKCHYQPISTLDRNLKQFMRPVVVQTISPLMLENFRGILECHYDHLPRRSQDMGTMQTRCSVAPSIDEHEELLPPPRIHSLTDSDIEAMKCEAKLDVIDNTTSEPLYAEIPCWRPPSAHAIEVVNLNGEAVTEL